MRILFVGLILLAGSLDAPAETVTLSGLGNGNGWNDGAYYTGYVTLDFNGTNYAALCIDSLHKAALDFNGTNYAALCIDALHETYGNSWDAVYVPLSDT